jgi:hypothetical protein
MHSRVLNKIILGGALMMVGFVLKGNLSSTPVIRLSSLVGWIVFSKPVVTLELTFDRTTTMHQLLSEKVSDCLYSMLGELLL